MMTTCLFSGRFDRPHIGHIMQAIRLGQKFDVVKIPVLDYPEQKYSVAYRMDILSEILTQCKGLYLIFSNKEHFATITPDEIKKYQFDVYVSGNHACLNHVESLGYKVQFIDRALDYSASEEFANDHR